MIHTLWPWSLLFLYSSFQLPAPSCHQQAWPDFSGPNVGSSGHSPSKAVVTQVWIWQRKNASCGRRSAGPQPQRALGGCSNSTQRIYQGSKWASVPVLVMSLSVHRFCIYVTLAHRFGYIHLSVI